ncbi:hypothetical protein HPB52_007991 [Rhipicephalus sanguineus]|uniref:Uncharacterized protein n=1 Tax=Rhipicephalus sanguineus TaxID=34632 RepID=A0A9D4Q509_RHISA|nr:hypothetical protein HPB52_007991 [Rhipicephalus sanguineus]
MKSPVPLARAFKYALRMIILAQFFRASKRGTYHIDDAVHLAEFISSRPKDSQMHDVVEAESVETNLSPKEAESLLYLSGYIVRSVIKKNKLCDICTIALKGTEETKGRLLALKNYVEGKQSLCVPSGPVSTLLREAEGYFRGSEKELMEGSVT